MRNVSIKALIMILILVLTCVSMSIFAYLSFKTYKKDKIAYVYDSLQDRSENHTLFLKKLTQKYDLSLSLIIPSIDINASTLPDKTLKSLETRDQILGLTMIDKTGEIIELYQGKNLRPPEKINFLNLREGLNLVDANEGVIAYKRILKKTNTELILFSKEMELAKAYGVKKDELNFLYNTNIGFFSREEVHRNTLEAIRAELAQTVEDKNKKYGVLYKKILGEQYFISYSKINHFSEETFITAIKESKVMLVQEEFLRQGLLIFLLVASISLLTGTLCAKWFSDRLDELTFAAEKFINEDFSHKFVVGTQNELGKLRLAFNKAGTKVDTLLSDLREYNALLEEKVAQRTSELQSLTNIQKAMLNSLGQAFVLIDKESNIHPNYSKITEDLFEVDPKHAHAKDLIGCSEGEWENLEKLSSKAFENKMSLKEIAQFLPTSRTNSLNRKIELDYAPLSNTESGELEHIMIIGTDKTEKYEAERKFQKEWKFSQMILKIASNKFALTKMIQDTKEMLLEAEDHLNNNIHGAAFECMKLIHTIKGNFSYFHIESISNLAHDLESELTDLQDTHSLSEEQIIHFKTQIYGVSIIIDEFAEHYDSILKLKDSLETKNIPLKNIEHFEEEVALHAHQLTESFKENFKMTQIKNYFEFYPDYIKELATSMSKSVRFTMSGENEWVEDGMFDELFASFIHFIRNSIDHGIEKKFLRKKAKKEKEGRISFSFTKQNDHLLVKLEDDGAGIDWEKLSKKNPDIQSMEDAISFIIKGGISSKEEVSNTSGRGVGVSAIFSIIEKLDGTYNFESTLGEGTKITIKLPFKSSRLDLNQAA